MRCLLLQITFRAVGVLQTEARFMAFSHLGAIERQQVVVGEHLNAVVVPKEGITIRVDILPFLLLEGRPQQQQQQ